MCAPTACVVCFLQLWAANNLRTIHVDFTRMVYDKESDLVLIDLLEYCRCARRLLLCCRNVAPVHTCVPARV